MFSSGESIIVNDAYADPNFERSIDERTGLTTHDLICTPITTAHDEIVGVAQVINKKEGKFGDHDLRLLRILTAQASTALESTRVVEKMQEKRQQEIAFLDIVADITSEIRLTSLLDKVMAEVTRLLDADRSTLFLNDDKTGELYTEISQGLDETGEEKQKQIRFPNHLGIAGAVFTAGETINIPYAYADLRFNPAFDKQTGYFTRSILCVPLANKSGKVIGATQVLNKRGGSFTSEDETRLKAFTGQISIALENAKLFDDVQQIKNYNESMLESMSNGIITIDPDGVVVTCNAAGGDIVSTDPTSLIGQEVAEIFQGDMEVVHECIARVSENRSSESVHDLEMKFGDDRTVSCNLTVMPLLSGEGEGMGTMLVIDDISEEKRLKSTMSRYMDPGVADQLLQQGDDVLGGASRDTTMLFSDIRGFTSITEKLGARGTVDFLNEYFTIMVECLQDEGGMLDKFIGDAIMAAFGLPVAKEDDPDRAVSCAIAMQRALQDWNQERQANDMDAVSIGIGINTDNVVSGNIGSPKRMDFTVIGDGVNLAARLESACKTYFAGILISEFTKRLLKREYCIREVDKVIVKGKSEPVAIYEVLDYYSESVFPNRTDVIYQFNLALVHYRRKEWDAAIKSFRDVLGFNGNDRLAQSYIERCEMLRENDPGPTWDGVWVMTTK